MTETREAVVLLSGGLDSSTVLAIAQEAGFGLNALTFRYGQRHDVEVVAARNVAETIGVRQHLILDIDPQAMQGSALTDAGIEVPRGLDPHRNQAIPVTYVPARNTIFLSYALAWAETLGAWDIFIGVNAVDYSGYPDCRPEYIEAYQTMANLATKSAVEGLHRMTIHTPLMRLSKKEIIAKGLALGVDYAATVTCYDPSEEGKPCARCDACQLRMAGFAANGLNDPAVKEA